MTERTGTEWTERHILGRAVHHEIQVNARIGHAVRLVRSEPMDGQKNEILGPAGCMPPLSAKAVRALLNAGEAGFDGWEHPKKIDFLGELAEAWTMEWELAPGEAPPVVRLENCRVSAAGVLQLAETYMPQAAEPKREQSPGTVLTLPYGTRHLRFDELPFRIADALWPLSDEADEVRQVTHGGTCLNLETELPRAVRAGKLPVLDPLTLGPHPFPHGAALAGALVAVDDLRTFLVGRLAVIVEAISADPTTALYEEQKAHRLAANCYEIIEAAQAIAQQLGLNKYNEEKLRDDMAQAAFDGKLTVRSPRGHDQYAPTAPPKWNYDYCCLTSPADVNEWAECRRFTWRWETGSSEPHAAPVVAETPETTEQRQARRYQLCIERGLEMPDNDYAVLPRGIKKIAAEEKISRQAFSEDVKAHIRRLAASRQQLAAKR